MSPQERMRHSPLPRFNRETANCLLELPKDYFGTEAVWHVAEERSLIEKDEFHITVIGSETGRALMQILDALPEEGRLARLAALDALIQRTDWGFVETEEYYYLKKEYAEPNPDTPNSALHETRESIIRMVELQGLSPFYASLNALFGTSFNTPPAHITLFTNSTREDKKLRGIGLYSWDEFHSLRPERLLV